MFFEKTAGDTRYRTGRITCGHAGIAVCPICGNGNIRKNGYNLNISRYVSTSVEEIKIDLKDVNKKLASINESIKTNTDKHNEFLKELGLDMI